MSSLAIRHRPWRFADLVGQPQARLVLESLARRVRREAYPLSPGLLFTGPRGVGKTSAARIFAAALNCQADDSCDSAGNAPCADCARIHDGQHPSVLELDGALSGGVTEIRQLAQLTRLAHPAAARVIVIDECHALSAEAFSALLKQLEEPAPDVTYVLVTTDRRAVPVAVRSRCLAIEFLPISTATIVDRLTQITSVSEREEFSELYLYIAKRASGSLRDAIMALEQISLTGDLSLAMAHQIWPDVPPQFAKLFVETALSGSAVQGMTVIQLSYAQVQNVSVMLDALSRYLADLAIRQNRADTTRRIADLMLKLWDYRIVLLHAPHDTTPLEGLWFAFHALLTQADPHPLRLEQPEPPVGLAAVPAVGNSGAAESEQPAAPLSLLRSLR